METQALINLLTEARAGLFPFISKRIDENGNEYETDFCTEVFCFHSNLLSVFQELEKNAINNSINFNSEVAGNYGIQATKILSQVRDQLRHFFHEDNEYQIQVRQIESENITEEPFLESTTAVSVSEKIMEYPAREVAIYANRVCQWGVLLLQRYTTEQGAEIQLPALNTIYEKLLLLEHSGIYKQIHKICGENKNRTADLIAAITGEKQGSIRVISSHLLTPHIKSRFSPYTFPAMDKIIALLIKLKFDPSELIKISEKKHSEIKK